MRLVVGHSRWRDWRDAGPTRQSDWDGTLVVRSRRFMEVPVGSRHSRAALGSRGLPDQRAATGHLVLVAPPEQRLAFSPKPRDCQALAPGEAGRHSALFCQGRVALAAQ